MPEAAPDSILIVGTGAMACLFAARLAAVDVRVVMLGSWLAGLEALQRSGVCLVDAEGQEHVYPVRATADPRDCAESKTTLVLVKSWQTARAAGQIASCLAPSGIAVTLQNGTGNREILAHALGENRVALGTTTSGATLIAPGIVRAAGEGTTSLEVHSNLELLSALLGRAGFKVGQVTDIHALVWGKLIINAAINPLSALLQVPNGQLISRLTAKALMAAIATEATRVAQAQGIHLPYPDSVAAAEATAIRTAKNLSSMLQDVLRGAPTEIDAINGAIVRAGEHLDIEVPLNRALWLLIKARVDAPPPS